MCRRFLLCALLAVLPVPLILAQSQDEERHHITFNASFGDNAFSTGIGYHYMVQPGLGLGASIGIWGDPEDISNAMSEVYWDHYYDDYPYPYYSDTDWTNISLYFEPSLLIRTPTVHLGGQCSLGLTVNPWFRIGTNHYSSAWVSLRGREKEVAYRSRLWSVGVRVGPTLRISACAISIGYEISNLDVNREYSNLSEYRSKPNHAVSLACAFYF